MAERIAHWPTVCIFAVAVALFPNALPAQEPPPQRLTIPPSLAAPQDGIYATGDDPSFMIDHAQGQTRLRFVGSDEIFYLSSERSTLGGRVLKYDTGEKALAVSGWGGVTLYSQSAPSGTPAERVGEAVPIDPAPVLSHQTKYFAAGLSQRLADRESLAIGFATRWDLLSHEDMARALATDAMRNATYAIEQLAKSRARRSALAAKLRVVRIVAGNAKSAMLQDDVLVVTFSPAGGPSARPSSLAILQALSSKF